MTLLALLYGVIVGGVAEYLNFYGYAYRMITTFIMMMAIKLISKKNIYDIFIIYAMIFLCITSLRIITTIVISSVSDIGLYSPLIIQSLSFITIILLYRKVPLSIFLIIFKKNLWKLFIFIVLNIFLVVFSYFYFLFTGSAEYIIYLSIMLALALIGLCHTSKRVSFYTQDIPAQLYDVKNILIFLQIRLAIF